MATFANYADELRKLSNDAIAKQALQRNQEIGEQVGDVLTVARQQAAKGDFYIEFTTVLYPEAVQILTDNGLTVVQLTESSENDIRKEWHISW